MVTSLTQARVDLHATANTDLTALVDKLERAVSELPAGYHHLHHRHASKKLLAGTDDDDAASSAASSTYDDPAELYHRDVGVQTSAPPSPQPPPPASSAYTGKLPPTADVDPTAHHASRLAQLATNIRAIAAAQVRQTEEWAATKGELEAFGADLHELTYPRGAFGMDSSYLYSTAASAAKNEPEDEIRRVKMSIRGVKGVLLNTRSFPATNW